MGRPPQPVGGRFVDGSIVYQQSGEQGSARYVYELVADDCFRFRIEASADGESWSPIMEGEYRRV